MSAFGIHIGPETVCIFEPGVTKHEALDSMVDAVAKTDAVNDVEGFRRAVLDRESVMSTGIGQGVAIPHVRIDAITRPTLGVGVSREGMDFDTLDDEPVQIVVMFAMPAGSQKEYLGLLAQVMMSLKTPGFRDSLLACETPDALLSVLRGE